MTVSALCVCWAFMCSVRACVCVISILYWLRFSLSTRQKQFKGRSHSSWSSSGWTCGGGTNSVSDWSVPKSQAEFLRSTFLRSRHSYIVCTHDVNYV